MSRSLIACALEARATTIVRIKSSGGTDCSVTACRKVGYGIEELKGPKGKKALAKIADSLREWRDEPLAISISPSSILTLPAWFPAGASQERREELARIEAGYFLRNIDEWAWQAMPVAHGSERPEGLEHQMILFSAAEPAKSFAREMGQRFDICMNGLHFEPLARLTAGSDEPAAVLELEEEYAVFFVARDGRTEYFRYWPVKHASEREFFAITELGSSPVDRVLVTGLAADAATVKRIATAASRTLEPLGIPPQASTSGAKGCQGSPGVVRAVSMAMMALSPTPG
ncbi:MAG: hypothetical protein HGB04_10415 [Chlorobiaceae bacterium]|nr:hypothetical protein [Chlorobiaceae bacterium]